VEKEIVSNRNQKKLPDYYSSMKRDARDKGDKLKFIIRMKRVTYPVCCILKVCATLVTSLLKYAGKIIFLLLHKC